MKTSKALYIFFLTIVILSLVVIAAAFAFSDADAQELEPDCPKPWIRLFKAFAANVSQCLGQYCGQEHSGPADGEPVR